MDKTEVHEMLTKLPDDQKMQIAIECQIKGLTVEQLEEVLAKIITGVQNNLTPALKGYEYLGGGTGGDYGRG